MFGFIVRQLRHRPGRGVGLDKLDGLGGAITGGRYLTEADTATPTESGHALTVPFIAASKLNADDDATVRIESIDPKPV
jgi:hypothetical protein